METFVVVFLPTPGARALTSGFPNGATSVPIVLDNLQCTGTESTLFACQKNTVGSHNCVHSEDAGVSCQPGNVLIFKD